MKKARYVENMNCPMSKGMYKIIKKITDEKEISFAEFIRDAINEKLKREDLSNDGSTTL